jgi:RNA polymerase sigma-70 factor (ECF subfamily)
MPDTTDERRMPDSGSTAEIFLPAGGLIERAAPPKPVVNAVDVDMVERVRAGDEEAFGRFYKRYAPMVHGIALARVPREEVDDLVQDVFISAFKNIRSLRESAAAGPWLAAMARNRAVEHYRSKARMASVEITDDIRGGDCRRNEASEILSTIRSLPDAYSETLVLRLVEGMTGPEIAQQTGLTPDSVRVNLHRGMKMLREKLGIEVK